MMFRRWIKLILVQNGTNCPQGKGVKRSNLGFRRSKVKVVRGRRQTWQSGGGISLDPVGLSSFSSLLILGFV